MSKREQPATDDGDPPKLTLDDMQRIGSISAGDALRMQQRARECRLRADELQTRGEHHKAAAERATADTLTREADLALDPVMHTTGRVTVGNGGELALGTKAMRPFVDLVRERPDMVVADASRQRMQLASGAGALTLGLEAADTIQATNSLEKMLVHEAAAAHVAAMELQAEARDVLRGYKNTGYRHPNLSVEAARLMNASARMMETYQRALLTLARLRSGGTQTMVVQHVNVADGGQAVVAGQVRTRPKRRRQGGGGGGQ